MPLRTQKQVMAELDKMSGRHMNRAAREYRARTIEPLAEAIRTAGNGQQALRQLDGTLLRRMNATALMEAVADDFVQSAMIGRVSALPKGPREKET